MLLLMIHMCQEYHLLMKYLEPENMSGEVFDEIFISDILLLTMYIHSFN